MPPVETPPAAVPPQRAAAGAAPDTGDDPLLARLRDGDESAFAEVLDAWSPMMIRVARSYVSTEASAEEITQETWLAVVRGLDGFEGRSSVRTWVFRILTNLAKTRGVREARSLPLSALAREDDGVPAVDPDRFRGPDDRWPDHWTAVGAPRPWQPSPEESALAGEVRRLLAAALDALPPRQATVVSLRDVHGLSADEVCTLLGLTAANQRVLLHRGRSVLRSRLEDYYRGAESVVAR